VPGGPVDRWASGSAYEQAARDAGATQTGDDGDTVRTESRSTRGQTEDHADLQSSVRVAAGRRPARAGALGAREAADRKHHMHPEMLVIARLSRPQSPPAEHMVRSVGRLRRETLGQRRPATTETRFARSHGAPESDGGPR
jgi:hypothetical protein